MADAASSTAHRAVTTVVNDLRRKERQATLLLSSAPPRKVSVIRADLCALNLALTLLDPDRQRPASLH